MVKIIILQTSHSKHWSNDHVCTCICNPSLFLNLPQDKTISVYFGYIIICNISLVFFFLRKPILRYTVLFSYMLKALLCSIVVLF